MSQGEATNMRRAFIFAVVTIISLFVMGQATAATIWRDFSQESQDTRTGSRLRNAVAISEETDTSTLSATTLASGMNYTSAVTEVALTAIQPTVLNAPTRNAYTYRFASTESASTSRRNRRFDMETRTGRDPIIRTSSGTSAATVSAVATPDSGRTILLMGGTLALLFAGRALQSRKRRA